MTALLEVDAIDVFYGPVQALRGVTLEINEREMVALVGPNGAGKTTTLRSISGLLGPKTGEIRFHGERIDGMPAYKVIERGIAHLPEGRELFRDLSVLDNLKLGHWVRGKGRGRGFKDAVDRVMDHFPILRERAHQAAGTLSGGEQQMLGVARALMSDPQILVVDELSLGLAPLIVDQLFVILEGVRDAGTSVLIVEQFVHMALQHTDRAYALAKGAVVLEGRSSDLADSPELMEAYLGETEPKPEPVTNGYGQKAAAGARRSRRK